MSRYSYWVCVMIFNVACDNVSENRCLDTALNKEITYQKEAINFTADTHQYNHELSKVVMLGGEEFFYALDNHNAVIDRYSFESKQHDLKITIKTEGSNAINTSGNLAFDVISEDSIVLLSPYKVLYIIDTKGKKLLERRLDEQLTTYNYPVSSLVFSAMGVKDMVSLPIIYNRNTNSVYTTCWWSETFMLTNWLWEEYKYPMIAQISILKDGPVNFIGEYPFDVSNNLLPRSVLNHFTFDANGCLLIQFDKSYEIYNDCTQQFNCIPSSYGQGGFSLYQKGYRIEDEEELFKFNTEESFIGIYFDKYKEVTYSVFLHSQKENDVNGLLNLKTNSSFSIIISDLDGRILGESLFPKNTYDFFNMNVTQHGLLISMENPYNQNNVENLYEFELIKFNL